MSWNLHKNMCTVGVLYKLGGSTFKWFFLMLLENERSYFTWHEVTLSTHDRQMDELKQWHIHVNKKQAVQLKPRMDWEELKIYI